jgi:lipoprotein-releasing system permease protein
MPSSAVGQQVNLYAINRKRISSLLPIGGYTRRTMPIAGVYNIDEENGRRIYTSLRMAQQLLNYPNRISAVEFSLSADASPKEVAAQIAQCASVEVRALTRNESNSIYRLMALEKWGVFFIALVVMLIASLSIVGTLVMVIIDKQQDMHTLRTMGASPALIRDIFIAEGHLMAAISLVGGVVLGGALALAQQHWGMVGIDTQTLLISAYPVEVHLSDILLTIVSYIIIAHIVIKLTVRATTRHQI